MSNKEEKIGKNWEEGEGQEEKKLRRDDRREDGVTIKEKEKRMEVRRREGERDGGGKSEKKERVKMKRKGRTWRKMCG